MITVYKYPISPCGEQSIVLPEGAEILCVQPQQDVPFLWARVNTEAKPEARSIVIVGTGHDCPRLLGSKVKYLNTFQLHEGALVFHAFVIER